MEVKTHSRIEDENSKNQEDLKNKIILVFNVLKACIMEQNENTYSNKVQKLLDNFDKQNKKTCLEDYINAAEVCNETDLLETSELDLEIREIIVKLYLMSVIPTMSEIKKNAGIYLNENISTIKQQLRRSGYIFKRIPKTKKVIIVEHPKQAILKQEYLTKMFRYRKERRHIVYVMEEIITADDKNFANFNEYLTDETTCIALVLVVSNNQVVHGIIFGCSSLLNCQERVEDYFGKDILPLLTNSCLIVLEDKPFYRKSFPVPTIESEKKEMMNWLELNNIPHSEDYHRSELFELIQKHKNRRDLHKFDTVLRANGHVVIRRPPRTQYLSYFRWLWDGDMANQPITPNTMEQLLSKPPLYWVELEKALILTEERVLNEDLKIENIVEKMINMANIQKIDNWLDEFDEGEDSLKQDEFIVKI